ncbi:virulence-associated E family protein [Anabaena lutea]|uniref:Virulence-associated protein E-like domain-containing protein n=1 Tax=Anabaena lutea FACHB-196 TaxID=2692881 RepID=A0ABR8F9I9_9NOST|nr:virulence-associated E family protein [Anabaena lutea]MBD2566417.1 hypothetical protein [Anabaena lutea FACHB-196]
MSHAERFVEAYSTTSSPNKSNIDDLESLLSLVERSDILSLYWNVPGSSKFNNKAHRFQTEAAYEIKTFINKAGANAGYIFWEVFKKAYKDHLQMNAWTGELLLDGKPTTHEELLDRLENALGMLSKLSKEQFERKFQVFMGTGFNPVRKELEAIAKQYTYLRTETVTPEHPMVKDGFCDVDVPIEIEDIKMLPEWGSLASILFGADDPLSQMMLEKWLIAAVARVMTPGCQADNTLVLMGKQGIGKSSFFRVLGGEYFLDLDNSTDGTEVKRQLAKSWIVELGEMEGITRKKEVEELKAFLTKTKDTFRGLFERKPADHPRHVVFGGTCNSDEVLRDPTGSRRFWIIPCGDRDINIDFLKENREAILASAYRLWKNGVTWWADKEMSQASEDRNKDYQESNEFEHIVSDLISRIEKNIQDYENRDSSGTDEKSYDGVAIKASDLMIAGLGIPPERFKINRNDRKVTQVLKEKLKYEKTRLTTDDGKQVWYWVKPGVSNAYRVTLQNIQQVKEDQRLG